MLRLWSSLLVLLIWFSEDVVFGVVGFPLFPSWDAALWSGISGSSRYYLESYILWGNVGVSIMYVLLFYQETCQSEFGLICGGVV